MHLKSDLLVQTCAIKNMEDLNFSEWKAAISEQHRLLRKQDFSQEKNFELKLFPQKVKNIVYYVLCYSIISVIRMYTSFNVR